MWLSDFYDAQQGGQISGGKRLCKIVSLRYTAAPASQQLQLLHGFHTLDDHLNAEFTGEAQGRPDDRIASGSFSDAHCEALGDFYSIDGVQTQIVERGVTAAEIVDCDAVASTTKPEQDVVMLARGLHEHALSQLQFEMGRR